MSVTGVIIMPGVIVVRCSMIVMGCSTVTTSKRRDHAIDRRFPLPVGHGRHGDDDQKRNRQDRPQDTTGALWLCGAWWFGGNRHAVWEFVRRLQI